MPTPKGAFFQFLIALRSLSAFPSTQLFWACFAETDEVFALMKIASVDVIWCGCVGEASIATDCDATDFDAGKVFVKGSDLGQLDKSVMLLLR